MVRPGVGEQYYFMVNQYGHIVFDSIDEEEYAYNLMLQKLLEQPRYFLDQLEHLKEFKVSWLNYASKATARKYGRKYAVSNPRNP